MPSPTGDILLWLFAIPVPDGGGDAVRLRMEPLASIEEGGGVVVAAVTAFRGSASPLALRPRRTVSVAGASAPLTVDLGQVFRHRPAPSKTAADRSRPGQGSIVGWGMPRDEPAPDGPVLVDLAMAPDATIAIGPEVVAAARLPPEGDGRRFGRLTIESLPTPTHRVEVEIVDAATGASMPARVRFQAADGRYLPPLGHRDEVNPGLNEDTGADLVMGGATYAYVPGRFPIALPPGPVEVEVVHGFDHRPLRRTVDATTVRGPLVLPLDGAAGPGEGWVAVDCHVHFISPTSALLQARAEGVAIVNLLATQWGDHHTSIPDMPGRGRGGRGRASTSWSWAARTARTCSATSACSGRPRRCCRWPAPARPRRGWAIRSSGSWPIGRTPRTRRAGWPSRCHFPLPYAEIAADIVAGRIDAVEMQALTPGIDGPSIREWYRFLNLGYRLPIVGGTDKMSAEIPLGAIRTYARLGPDEPPSFEAWATAVRAGRTFVSSGTFIDLAVEDCGPGDVVKLGGGGGTVEVRVSAWAAQPVIDRLELIHDGRVVADTAVTGGERGSVSARVEVSRSGWIAARATSNDIDPVGLLDRAWEPTAPRSISRCRTARRGMPTTPRRSGRSSMAPGPGSRDLRSCDRRRTERGSRRRSQPVARPSMRAGGNARR